MNAFTEYLDKIAQPEQRLRIQELLAWVHHTFPELEPRIAWNQPMFTHHDTFIIGFSIAKPHIAISPEASTIAVFREEITAAGYTQGSNLFRIKWNEEIDYALLQRMIQFNIDDKANCTTFWRT